MGWVEKQKLLVLGVMVVVVVAIASSSDAQSICNMSSEGFISCKPSVTPPNPTPPTAACCSALSHADLHCLCTYKNSKLLPSLGIDPKLAMQLPAKCRLPHSPTC